MTAMHAGKMIPSATGKGFEYAASKKERWLF
jgi:hypothetical protein